MRTTHPSTLVATAALAGAVVVALALGGCRGNKSADPPVHLVQNMDFQQRYTAQEPNPWFHDGSSARPRVAGTVPRTETGAAGDHLLRADDHLYRARGADGRLVDALPPSIPLDEALLARGQARFNIFCAPCHDGMGTGKGIVAQRGLKVMPPSYHSDTIRAMPLGYFFDVISEGKATMLPYAAQIPDVRDRWAIAAWVRTLQVSQTVRLADVPPNVAADKGWVK
jgi:mono/diheme cytochrome c family protein